MAVPPAPPTIEPLLYEIEAARIIGVPARALRSERTAGRIGYRKVAGRIMYRLDDLKNWQENIACPVHPRDHSSDPIRSVPGHSISTGRTQAPGGAGSVQRALASADQLIKSSRTSSRPASTPEPSDGMGHVVRLRQE
jgi:hypothetical protein